MIAPEKEKEKGGSGEPPPSTSGSAAHSAAPKAKQKDYKLLLDPCLVKGVTKLYRFSGFVPDDPTYPSVIVRDPRSNMSLSRIWNRLDGLELPIPRFRIDANYVGIPPPVEVSITNLNDNVDIMFLCDLLQKFGTFDDVHIYYHPQTNRHMGLARVIFEYKSTAKTCVAKLNNSPVMGNVLNVFLDPFGKFIKSLYQELIEEKKVEVKKGEKKKSETEPNAAPTFSMDSGQSVPPLTQHPGETPLQQPTQTPIQHPMQTPRQHVLATPNQQPKPTPTQLALATPTLHHMATPSQHPLATPNQHHMAIPSQHPMATPNQHPMATPNQHPMATPNQHPMATPNQHPMATPSQHPMATPNQHPIATPSQHTMATPNQHTLPTPSQHPMATPTQHPIQLPNQFSMQTPIQFPSTPGPYPNIHSISPLKMQFQTPLPVPPPIPQPTTPVAAPALSKNPGATEQSDDDLVEIEPRMDLDTRIKFLLKSKKSFAKFLGFESSGSENEGPGKFIGGFTIRRRKSLCVNRNNIWKSESSSDDEPSSKRSRDESVSPPPSPFLDRSGYSRSNGTTHTRHDGLGSEADEQSDDSSFETRKSKKGNRDRRTTGSDDPSKIQLPPEPSDCNYSLPPLSYPACMNQFFQPTVHYTHHEAPQTPRPPETPMKTETYPSYNQAHQWGAPQPPPQHYFHATDYAHMQPYLQPPQLHPPPPLHIEEPMSPASELKKYTTGILSSVFERLTQDLRLILRRDCQKKFIESSSYKTYEEWFNNNFKRYKDMKEMKDREKKRLAGERNGNFEMGISEDPLMGIGFRANIPKLPSFKIQKKVPPPVAPVEKSPEKTVEVEEDSDWDSHDEVEIGHKPRPARRLSLSSDAELSAFRSSESKNEDSSSHETPIGKLQQKENEKRRVRKALKAELDLWVESISEDDEVFSPKPPLSKDVVEKKSKAVEMPTPIIAIVEKEEAVVVERPLTPLPPSPSRVSMEGPYVHLHDHTYNSPPHKAPLPKVPEAVVEKLKVDAVKIILKPKLERKPRAPPKPHVVKPEQPTFRKRSEEEERNLLTDFLTLGVDAEDLVFFKRCYDNMKRYSEQVWVNQTHWVDHPPTKCQPPKPKKNRRVHLTGAARTEGFYKLDAEDRRRHKLQWATATCAEYSAPGTAGAVGVTALAHQDKHQGMSQIEKSRVARSQQRRLLISLGHEVVSTSDLLKYNQLKFRKKNLRFQRSTIHDWGLFAAEPIAADEMVIEYVGQTIRPCLADIRERKYEDSGIGSSYLFRIDLENIIDATKCGNLSRFINHSCSPNCYAKIITIEAQKTIVIYSKQAIAVNEEITYDYKFPFEDKKIICLCGTPQCRGTLN